MFVDRHMKCSFDCLCKNPELIDSIRKQFWRDSLALPQEQKVVGNSDQLTIAATVHAER